MPQPPGFEPYSEIWVVQVRWRYNLGGFYTPSTTWLLGCRYFVSESGYNSYKSWLINRTDISLVQDYGKQKWYNTKLWVNTQLMDQAINGNFSPNLLP
jgi:hypothetical protein